MFHLRRAKRAAETTLPIQSEHFQCYVLTADHAAPTIRRSLSSVYNLIVECMYIHKFITLSNNILRVLQIFERYLFSFNFTELEASHRACTA
jgi:hypothetical protein